MQQEMVDMEAQARTQKKNEVLSIFSKANRPVTLKFDNVVYKVKTQNRGFLPKNSKPEEKIILKGVTGIVSPGEILAMLGPSGSGKTTLLTALGGRLSGQLSGRITYNDKPFSNVMKRNTGFVLQDDVLYPHLTVTETLVFTALLRLPNSLTKDEKISHAESVIAQLGLTRCRSSIIGGPLIRGVSGGERKRVSIGQEMLMNPSLLLLDEPTSGLDSTTAQRIVSTLWELSNGGRTVVMTIHQPSSRIFYLFNKVLLLSEGNPIYFGNASEAMEYFSRIGYTPSVAMNPSDFMLDLANGVSSDDSGEDHNVVKQTLVSAFKSNIEENLKAQVRETCTHHYDMLEEKKPAKWATTWCEQFLVLLRRGVKEWKHETFNGLKVGQVLVVAFLSGLLWWKSSVARLQDQIGLLFFYSGFWGFFPLFHGLFVFSQDRMILQKERSSGMYRLSAYFIARIVGGLPMDLVLPTVFVTVTYWMAGLKPTALNFLHTLFVLLYNVLVTQGLGLALGAAFMDQKSAAVLGSVTMLTFQLAGGFFVQHVPSFISWIKYVSVSQHAYKLLLGSQYTANEAYPCPENLGGNTSTCFVGDFPTVKQVGLDGQALSVAALGIMLVAYRLIAYVSLIRIGVTTK